MKRIMSLTLALVMLLGMFFTASFTASADSTMTTSSECIEMLKAYEGFCKYPYEDYGQWTVGYGTKCPADKLATYKVNGITEEEAEALLQVYIKNYEKDLNYFVDKYSLQVTQNQFDAMFLFSYNCGSGWIYSNSTNFHKTMANPNADADDVLYYFGLWSNAGNTPLDGLIKRRLSEANMYLNGVYATNYPTNFRYVKYDANGGVVEGRVHAYNTDSGDCAPLVPSYSGHTFEGWYTEKTGGTQVTKLDASVHGLTLYARWSNQNPETEDKPVEIEPPVVVKVITDELIIRKGPGTNYTILGTVHEGDQLSLTQAAYDGLNRLWGKFSKGWVCLEYTNYDEVTSGTDTPENGSNGTTNPGETEKPAPAPKVTGTITANGGLFVRSGPGTGYNKVGAYARNAKVEILEQKAVGAAVWGRTDKGWISMAFVKLDSADTQTPGQDTNTSGNGISGTVKASGGLSIRKGPGTSYGIVGYLYNGNKVTITEQKVGGSHTWGKISNGWISMTYVVLDSTDNGSTDNGSTDNGSTDNGSTDNGSTDNGSTDNGSTGNGSTDNGSTDNGSTDNGSTDNGSTDNGSTGNGSTDNGSTGNGSTDNGSTDNGSTDNGSTDNGSTDNGSTDNGSTDNGSTDNGSTGNGSTDNGSTDNGSTDNGSTDNGSTDNGSSSGGNTTTSVTGTVTVNSVLNIRSGAGSGYGVVGFYKNGTRVEILEKKTVGSTVWGKTSKGWVSLDYVKLDGDSGSSGNTNSNVKTVTASCLLIRASASTSSKIVGYLYKGDKITVTETTTAGGYTWGKTSKGWVALMYTK